MEHDFRVERGLINVVECRKVVFSSLFLSNSWSVLERNQNLVEESLRKLGRQAGRMENSGK